MHAGTRWTFIISELSTASNSTPTADNKQSRKLTVTRKAIAHTMSRIIALNQIPMPVKWCLYANSKTISVSDRIISSGVVSESLLSVPPSALYASAYNSNSEVCISLITITTKIFFSYTQTSGELFQSNPLVCSVLIYNCEKLSITWGTAFYWQCANYEFPVHQTYNLQWKQKIIQT